MKRIDAIVYTSNTGYTKEYVKLMGQEIGCPWFTLEEAQEKVPEHSHIIYLGWLMAGAIFGYKKAIKRYEVDCVLGVGLSAPDVKGLIQSNKIPETTKAYALQGGFDMNKLSTVHKLMMKMVINTAGKKLKEKENKTPEDEVQINLMFNGGTCVSKENLSEFFTWYKDNYGSLTDQVEAAYQRNVRDGKYQVKEDAIFGSIDNPEVQGDKLANSLYFDYEKGKWILTDGLGNGFMK